MGRPMMRSLSILLSILLLRSPGALGENEWCMDSGDNSTASNEPKLYDGSDQDEDFRVNEEVLLYCCFASKQSVNVKWYKDDTLLTAGGRYHFGENNQVLSIRKGSKCDEGKYRCEGYNQDGRQSHNISVNMHLPQCKALTVNSSQRNVSVKKGKSVILTCLVKSKKDCGTILSAFYWRNPKGKLVIKNTKMEAVPSGGSDNIVRMTLTIRHAKKRHSGAYRCITKNVSATTADTVILNVE